MLNSKIYKTEIEIPMQSGKTTITKKLFAFIVMMFSVAFVNAQCFMCPTCPPGKVWGCHWKNDCSRTCKCVNIGSNWINGNPGCATIFRMENQGTNEGQFGLTIYPNPFSTSANIFFALDEAQNVSLKVFDMNGRLVTILADASFEEGDNEIVWNAAEVNAGIYFLRMETASYSENRKLVVVK